MRFFVAVFPPEAALAHLIETLSSAGVKTTPPERLHLTLAFLGDQPDPEPALAALDIAFGTTRPAAHSSHTTPAPSPSPPPSESPPPFGPSPTPAPSGPAAAPPPPADSPPTEPHAAQSSPSDPASGPASLSSPIPPASEPPPSGPAGVPPSPGQPAAGHAAAMPEGHWPLPPAEHPAATPAQPPAGHQAATPAEDWSVPPPGHPPATVAGHPPGTPAGRLTATPVGQAAADARPGTPSPEGPQLNARATSSGSARGQGPVPAVGELAISGGGRFGALLWAGITGDIDGLTRLTRLVRRSLRAKRVRPDDKRFRPHITVARRVQPEPMSAGLAVLRHYNGPIWTPQELVLVHSEIGPNPAYHRLQAWPLPAAR